MLWRPMRTNKKNEEAESLSILDALMTVSIAQSALLAGLNQAPTDNFALFTVVRRVETTTLWFAAIAAILAWHGAEAFVTFNWPVAVKFPLPVLRRGSTLGFSISCGQR
jgi:hypothetical protein